MSYCLNCCLTSCWELVGCICSCCEVVKSAPFGAIIISVVIVVGGIVAAIMGMYSIINIPPIGSYLLLGISANVCVAWLNAAIIGKVTSEEITYSFKRFPYEKEERKYQKKLSKQNLMP